MNKGKETFIQANALRDVENYDEAIGLYKKLLAGNEYNRFEVLLQLAGCCYFSGRYLEAYQYYKCALDINSDEEIASLGFYLACTKIDKLEEGLLEMKRYLDKNSPKLYRDTIDELVTGLKKGYATDFKEIILGFIK